MPLLNYVLQNTRPGDINGIINAIDRYGWTRQWLMNIGDRKGKILDGAIRQRRPRTILELGRVLFICLIHNNRLFAFNRYFSWL